MNILCEIMWEWTEKMLLKMLDKYPVNAIYAMWTKDRKDMPVAPELEKLIKYKFVFDDINMGNYDQCLYYDEMLPLDEELLDTMAPYEPEILKMMDRRYYFSNEDRFMQYHLLIRYWSYFLDKADIDFFITALTPHGIFNFTILKLCQIKEIPVIQFEIMPFMTTTKLLCYSDYTSFDEKIINLIKDYRNEYQTADEVKLSDGIQKEYEMLKEGKEKYAVQILNVGKKKEVTYKKSILRCIRMICPKKIRKVLRAALMSFQWNVYKKDKIKWATIYAEYEWLQLLEVYEKMAESPDLNVPYIYFPLQWQPELSTSPKGGWFVHQYLAIEMLSYYVPEGVYIYVKEHPVIKRTPITARSVEHYYRIKALKNVKLIDMNVETNLLIDHAVAVSSMTGSVGYEALYRKKPYIMFGNQVMKYAYGTFNVRNREDCKKAVTAIFLERFSFNNRDIKVFLKVIDEVSVSVKLDGEDFFAGNEENITVLTKMYMDTIDKVLINKIKTR